MVKMTPTQFFLAALALAGCAAPSVLFGETVGEHFRRVMADKEAFCKAHPPARGDTQCEILNLKPRDWSQTTFVSVAGQPDPVPQEWVSTPEGKFAQSIEIPNPVPKDSGYREGMTSEEYFKHLCETEAGEFIYKTVDKVEGVLQMRPRERATDYMLEHLYVMEDPYGVVTGGQTEHPEKILIRPSLYRVIEQYRGNHDSRSTYRQFIGNKRDPKGDQYLQFETADIELPKSRYGFTWRGIRRSHDREFGIAGSELIILNVVTSEILAVRRGFSRTGDVRNVSSGVWWLGAHICPHPPRRAMFYTFEFLENVLKPAATKGRE